MSKEGLIPKCEVAELLETTVRTLATYCNKRYFPELEKLGYRKSQKKFTPIQYEFLKNKLGMH